MLPSYYDFVEFSINQQARAVTPQTYPVAKQKMRYVIDSMTPDDWREIRLIYLEGISTGHSTFEADAPDWEKDDKPGKTVKAKKSNITGNESAKMKTSCCS